MGQQQLLLIVLVLIAIGAAILVGMQVFDETNREVAIDTITKDLVNLGTIAMNYYRTPVEMGGGSQSFRASSKGGNGNWIVPPNLDSLDNRTYTVNSISDKSIEILGQSQDEKTGLDNTEGVKVYVELNNNGVTGFRIEN